MNPINTAGCASQPARRFRAADLVAPAALTVEEFDALEVPVPHEFSEAYQTRKRALIAEAKAGAEHVSGRCMYQAQPQVRAIAQARKGVPEQAQVRMQAETGSQAQVRECELVRAQTEACALARVQAYESDSKQPGERPRVAGSAHPTPRRVPVRAAHRFTWKVAAAIAAVCVALPVGAYATISHEDFFNNAFGDAGRTSVAAHEVVQPGDGVKHDVHVIAPSHEYVPVDAEEAEALIGDVVLDTPAVIERGGHTITVMAAVRSEDALVMQYTVAREGGVSALWWDSKTNETKGAMVPDGSPLYWYIEASKSFSEESVHASTYIYVDPDRSTDECLLCYGYSVFNERVPEGATIQMDVMWADDLSAEGTAIARTNEEIIELPAIKTLAATAFHVGENEASMRITPISIWFDMEVGLDLEADQAYDPGYIGSVVITYADGSTYVVFDDSANIQNTSNALGGHNGFGLVFNRLVDPADIASVTVTRRVFSEDGEEASFSFTYTRA